jgi:hypothetical protein
LELSNHFQALSHSTEAKTDIESIRRSVRDTYLETSEKVLSFRNHLQKEWMSESTWEEIKSGNKPMLKLIRVEHDNRNWQHKQSTQKWTNA